MAKLHHNTIQQANKRFVQLPKINGLSIIHDYDDEHYDALKQRKQWADKLDTGKHFTIVPVC